MYENKKLSEIDVNLASQYIKVDDDEYDEAILKLSIHGAIDYIKGATNLSIEELDQLNNITIAALMLISDFYDNRGVQIESNTKVNNMLTSILSMNRDLG